MFGQMARFVFRYRQTPRRPIDNPLTISHDDQKITFADGSGTQLYHQNPIYQAPTTYEGIAVPAQIIGSPAGSARSTAAQAGPPHNWGWINRWVGQHNARYANLNQLTTLIKQPTPSQAAQSIQQSSERGIPDYLSENYEGYGT